MCGIFGYFSIQNNLDESNLERVFHSMNHRGPDMFGSSTFLGNKICLAHKRLSIIDQSDLAKQPMELDNGDLSIVFNGEIYNYLELIRDDISLIDVDLVSKSDTEILLHLYKFYGFTFVKKLKGMWAFIIYDRSKSLVFMSRDRIGMKPLYYFWNEKELIVSSEIKSIISSGKYEVKMDFHALNEYLTFQNIISNRTLFEDVKILSAGHNMILDLKTMKLDLVKYWDLELVETDNRSVTFLKDEFRDILTNSVNRHLIGDAKIGLTLSGGLDSSSILALKKITKEKIETFTGYFDVLNKLKDEKSNNENEFAKKISEKFQSQHNELLISSKDVIGTIDELVWHLEDPRVGMSYTFLQLSKLVSTKVTVNLSGTGGDEILAGYPWRYEKIVDIDENQFNNKYYEIWQRVLKDDEKKIALKSNVLDLIDLNYPYNKFNEILSNDSSNANINKALYFDFKTLLHGFLIVEDKLGMASSIETRFPFLDYDLIEFVRKLPVGMKFNNGRSKFILRESLSDILPDYVLNAKKQGFTPPDFTWYANEILEDLKDLLLNEDSKINKLFNKSFVNKLFSDLKKGVDNRSIVWALLFLEKWIYIFKPSNI